MLLQANVVNSCLEDVRGRCSSRTVIRGGNCPAAETAAVVVVVTAILVFLVFANVIVLVFVVFVVVVVAAVMVTVMLVVVLFLSGSDRHSYRCHRSRRDSCQHNHPY